MAAQRSPSRSSRASSNRETHIGPISPRRDTAGFKGRSRASPNLIGQSQTWTLPIGSEYDTWGSVEAFSELIQNWRDNILKAFNLSEKQFEASRKDRNRGAGHYEIIYKALKANSEPEICLGYIRFESQDGRGTVEITSRQSSLKLNPPTVHGSPSNRQMSGVHGDGVTAAFRILQQDGRCHSVTGISKGFNWAFNLNTQDELVVRRRGMTPDYVHNLRVKIYKAVNTTLTPFATDPMSDLSLFVGGPVKERVTGSDSQPARELVTLQEFESWCEIVPLLCASEYGEKVSTRWGDLLLRPKFRGNLYLEGILLRRPTQSRSASITENPLRYGYNFLKEAVRGNEVNPLSSCEEEGLAILSIWDWVLRRQPTYVAKLSEMLNSPESWADVFMASELMPKETAVRLRDYLFSDTSRWCYSAKEKRENPRIQNIIEGFGLEGFQLQDSYWSILDKYDMVRSVWNEQYRRIQAAGPTEVHLSDDDFAIHVQKALKGCLRAWPHTDNISVDFVAACPLSFQSLYVSSNNVHMVKVHDRWSKQESAATELGLMSRIGKWDIVFHTVTLLLNDILSQVPHTQFAGVDGQLDRERGITLATHRLLEYTRDSATVDIQDLPLPSLNSLNVKWRGLNMPLPSSDDADRNGAVRIQLHMTSTCKKFASFEELSAHLLAMVVKDAYCCSSLNSNMTCRVSDVKTSSSDAWHSFDGLELGVEYFAIIYKPSDPCSIPVVTRPCRCEAVSPSQSVRKSMSTPSTQSTPISLPSEVNREEPLVFVPEQGIYERAQMESLTSSIDILALRDWYGDPSAPRGGRVIVGVAKSDGEDASSRKRRRT
ncbi:hypothetical protein NM208_g10295 [Fusarium decemcellulare]|uniref:Uncharacterized protein n=2 Tax=Fusarium decemcellulare TaxID=57161 RepID=A0ACC1RYL0_9HYPO|nr:hypothetical protein NM208_g11190 [Fusarium decemcellulare]KAJ3528238.1 hypothetical protein NM208_g10295 [Fusarium decemcellulare]